MSQQPVFEAIGTWIMRVPEELPHREKADRPERTVIFYLRGKFMRIVAISDTHCQLSKVKVPQGDLLIHCGDWTYTGQQHEMIAFGNHLRKLKHPHKLLIPGNHDLTMDPLHENYHVDAIKWINTDSTVTIAINEPVHILGLNILCCSMIPKVGRWAFGYDDLVKHDFYGQYLDKKIDILVTHGPPRGILDEDAHYGCLELRAFVEAVKPKYHLFGHCHGNYDILTLGETTFVNASTCNMSYLPTNKPVILEI